MLLICSTSLLAIGLSEFYLQKNIELGEFILLSCHIKMFFLHFSKQDNLTLMMSNIFASWTLIMIMIMALALYHVIV